LGYIFLSNGKMLNEEILKAGYASLLTYPPNVRYQERFLKAYREREERVVEKGPRQHILPRLLLKGFASRVEGNKIFTWVHWKNGKILEVSIKDVSVGKSFYGKEGEASVDAEISVFENRFGGLINELRDKANGTVIRDPSIADFITHLCVRTKHLRDSFQRPSEFLVNKLQEYLSNIKNVKTLILKNPKIMEDAFKDAIKNINMPPFIKEKLVPLMPYITSAVIDQHKEEIQLFSKFLFTQLKNSLPTMIKKGHISALEKGLIPEPRAEKYRSLKWFVCQSETDLILGDVACLFAVKGKKRYKSITFADDEIENIYLPISYDHILIGTPLHSVPEIDFKAINEAYAKCSRDYFVSSKSSPEMAALASRIGEEAEVITNEELEEIIKETFAEGRR